MLSFLFFWTFILTQGSALAGPRANILFVLIDDMGYGDLSCYGGQSNQTPHIDRLASEGIRFTQFYVGSPICSPSRTALITGQFPARWGITSYLASRSENERRGMPQWLNPKAPTLARVLKQAGYATGHFGKWHMGGQRDVGEAPLITEYGFDESLTQFEGLGDRILPLCDPFDGSSARQYALGSDKLGRGKIEWMDRSKVTSAFVQRAIAFMQRAEKEGKPFYVNVWPDDVHSPFFPPKALRGDGTKRKLYLGVVKAMDEQFAALFDFVRSSPTLRTNTLVLICSDNGPEPGAGSAGPFRGQKGNLYEGGTREPFIVWGPGFIPESARGTVNTQTVVCAVDFLPSIARLAGAPLPAGDRFDGEALDQAWLGQSLALRSKPLFWVRPPDRPGNGERWPDLAMREGDWKLLLMRDGSEAQLYDLSKDLAESHNVAAEQPEVVRRLSRELLEWHKTLPPVSRQAARRPAPNAASATFMNPIGEGADPWMLHHGTNYYTVQSDGNRAIALYDSDRLSALGHKHVVWRAPEQGPCSREVWAPELHFLDNHFYIYVAASDGQNRNHRMWALQSAGADVLGPYTAHGPLYTGDRPETGADNRWAIDGTVLEERGKRYFVWSGWEDTRDEQWLYIAPMKDPLTTAGKRVRVCANNDHLWERVGETLSGRGLHEAPQVLQRSGRTFLTYSCSGSWQASYKLGLLELRAGGDPLKPEDWRKFPEPVFRPTETTYGLGHNSFVKSPDGAEDWLVFHAKQDRRDGWRRSIHIQPFGWTASGLPDFGTPLDCSTAVALPSGEPPVSAVAPAGPWQCALQSDDDLARFHYFGHHQFIQVTREGLQLGKPPAEPINDYRCGEKVLLANRYSRDLSCSVRVKVVAGGRDAGLLFRCTLPSVGYDAQNGYFAGLIPSTRKVVLGSTDCRSWREIALVDAPVENGRDYVLSVTARGPELAVALDGRELLRRRDNQHTGGSIGLRVVDSQALFRDFRVQ